MAKYVLPLLLLAEVAVFAPYCGVRFESVEAFRTSFGYFAADVLKQAAPLLILVPGMTIVLMSAGIDLSVGSATALVACVMSTFEPSAAFWATAVPLGLVVGIGLGAFNGIVIARLDVPPIIATLGTLFAYRGLCQVVMGSAENAPFAAVPGYAWFGTLAGSLVVAGAVLAMFFLVVERSPWKREVLMLGGNRVAARYAAIPVDRRTIEVYTLVGALTFLAAVCATARNASVKAGSLEGLELHVIVATVLGGTRVSGGQGSLAGSVLGVLLVAVLAEGLRGADVWLSDSLPFRMSHLHYVLLGALLLVGVWLSRSSSRAAGGENVR